MVQQSPHSQSSPMRYCDHRYLTKKYWFPIPAYEDRLLEPPGGEASRIFASPGTIQWILVGIAIPLHGGEFEASCDGLCTKARYPAPTTATVAVQSPTNYLEKISIRSSSHTARVQNLDLAKTTTPSVEVT
ncbi:hypothetical protein PHLCEN_2v3747 [Hermanssonia centrifuga]|uniref:Uncharacterized protein n=1 Tax=Hermanssonia centrifuga TaxID=98765 RepID=A0A2R6QBQ5_9APHY|nr:hypothetical protein PHLCEN_2v3747 [Hermanssonia centrifuga]